MRNSFLFSFWLALSVALLGCGGGGGEGSGAPDAQLEPAAAERLHISDGFRVEQRTLADDGRRYTVALRLVNTGETARDWHARLEGVRLLSLWGGHVSDGKSLLIKGNESVAPGDSVEWGFEAERERPRSAPVLQLDRESLNFAPQRLGAVSEAQSLTLTNGGREHIVLHRAVLTGADASAFRVQGCVGDLAPGAHCTLEVRYTATASGSQQAALQLDGSMPSRTLPLSGSGVSNTAPANPEPAVPQPTPTPTPTPEMGGYRAVNGQIVDSSGKVVQIRGVNMYGFNADILIPQYLWAMGWKEQIQQVKQLGFNSIRVPFVPDTLYVEKPGYFDPNKNTEFVGKTPLQIMDIWLAELDRQGLYFVLDFHSVAKQRQNNTWHTNDTSITWNGQPYTEDDWVRDLTFVARRYAHLPRFMGIDLYNEPTGEVRWGDGDKNAYKPENDWKRASERAGNAVLKANPKLLVFVEGISANWDGVEDSNVPINFGENIRPQAYLPLQIPNDKLVFAPHSYGPDVYQKSTFSHPDFPRNLEKDWEDLFGRFHPTHPVVMGEFGGKYGNGTGGAQDKVWQDAFVDYLIKKGMRGGFYWCYTPNSHDTGGILDDDLTVREDKMTLLRRLWGL